jgi:prepilin-type N-terminal cleavage/methylation domain-containing protein
VIRRLGMRPRGGFTVIELMVVIGIIGIGSAMAVSSLITVMPRWRLQGSATDVLTQLQYSRFEAVKRNRPVIVQFTNIGNVTTSGMTICVDGNRLYDGVCAGAGKIALKTLKIPDLYPRVYISTVADAGGAVTSITFGPDGMVRGGTMPVTITMASPIVSVAGPPALTNYQVVMDRSGIGKTAP